MLKKALTFLLIMLFGVAIGYVFIGQKTPSFKSLSAQEMLGKIVEQREYAISRAVTRGEYRCCIHPPCTMCYMEANQWNNQTAGTCVCDDLIAQGKEPCPQCKRGLCETDAAGKCETSGNYNE